MDIFEYAMEMEKEGEDFYKDLAEQSANEGMKQIFRMLADNEKRHYRAFAAMKRQSHEFARTPILEDARTVFEDMQSKKLFDNFEEDHAAMYKKAQEIEKKSEDFYREQADKAEDARQKKIFLDIAKEEKAHYNLLDALIVMVERPKTWLEDAEFYHLEEY